MTSEPDPIDSMFLHNHHDISEYLGNKWELMKAGTAVKRSIDYLY
jgi:hypothetical protein